MYVILSDKTDDINIDVETVTSEMTDINGMGNVVGKSTAPAITMHDLFHTDYEVVKQITDNEHSFVEQDLQNEDSVMNHVTSVQRTIDENVT